MKYGVALPTGAECGDPALVVELAMLAEESGFDGVFLEDYVLFQGDPVASTCDPWVALAAIAVRTERVVLGTLVTALARRRPWIVARQAAAIDQLSAGRMVLGVGLGDTGEHVLDDASLTRFGEATNPAVRAEILDEALDIITGLWTGQRFSYHGRHHTVDDVTFVPRPIQRPRIPIWVGGGYPNPGPTRRAARWDGACMYGTEQHDLQPEQVRALRDAAGGRPYDVCVGGRLRRDGDRSWLSAVAVAGATWWAEYVPPGDPAEMRDMIKRGPLRIE